MSLGTRGQGRQGEERHAVEEDLERVGHQQPVKSVCRAGILSQLISTKPAVIVERQRQNCFSEFYFVYVSLESSVFYDDVTG